MFLSRKEEFSSNGNRVKFVSLESKRENIYKLKNEMKRSFSMGDL